MPEITAVKANSVTIDNEKSLTLTVIVPVYNVAPWISECVTSILAQDIDSMEVLIVDDGSTDGTVELLTEFAAGDSRIQVVTGASKGSAASRNLGVRMARGDYLVFADGDDIVPAGAYRNLIRALDESGSDLAAGNFLTFDMKQVKSRQNDIPIYGTRRTDLTLEDEPRLLRDRVCWNKLFRRTFWLEHNIEFADSIRSNDIFAVVRALSLATIEIIPDIVYLYRKRPGASSMTAKRGDLVSLQQHMVQERACVEYLAVASSPAVQAVNAAVVLHFSLWDHVISLVQRIPAPNEDRAFVAALYAEILWFVDDAGKAVWEGLPRPAKWLYSLIRADRLDLMPALPLFGNKARQAEMLAEMTVTIHTYLQLRAAVEPDVHDLFARVIRERLYPALLETALEDPDLFAERAAFLLEVQRALVARARLAPDAVKIVDFIGAGKLDKARARAILQRVGGLVASADPAGRGSVRLDVTTGAAVPDGISISLGTLHARRPANRLARTREFTVSPKSDSGAVAASYRVSSQGVDPERGWKLHVDVQVGEAQIRYLLRQPAAVSS